MRQKPIGDYIVDFYCSKLNLVIDNPLTPFVKGEDGESHNGKYSYDMQRQSFLESMRLTVLRFNDTDVKRDINNVLMAIEGWIEGKEQPPNPLY